MGEQTKFFHRDASDRLCFEIWAVESAEYATLAAGIAEHFDLTPVGRWWRVLMKCFASTRTVDLASAWSGTTGPV